MNAIAGLFFLLALTTLPSDEIDVVEDFALAADRDPVLRQLIPGTDDYYYYHCLHFQNTRQFDRVEPLLAAWVERRGHSARQREIRHRQALLTYPENRAETLDYLRRELGLRFDHRRETRTEETQLPTRLDARLLDRQRLRERALARRSDLAGFEDRALEGLLSARLSSTQRRHLLQRLDRPDHTGLPRLIVEDLRERSSSGFGSLPIHERLLLAQLDECLTLAPELLDQSQFVATYLTKLQPSNDVDWRRDPEIARAYLSRQWSFVQRLGPAFNSLKVHVLYHLLLLERSQGIYDKDRFLAYLALPRRVSYIDPRFLERESRRSAVADLSVDFSASTTLARVGDDEALVRSFLEHFLVSEDSTRPYEPFIDDTYLEHLFAEVKILSGQGDPERWAALLPPDQFQALKERVDILFEPTNAARFGGDEPVRLDLQIKNVETLIVKIFEIHTKNFYRSQGREVDTDINLDGLVPNQELTFTYESAPLRRFSRQFDFPDLDAPGVYVIDFIGNGRSSRALIRKGDLGFVQEIGPDGQIFTIYDEERRIVRDAVLWIEGREYRPEEDGRVLVPFTHDPTEQRKVVLSRGDLSVLDTFEHVAEEYELTAGIHVERESLIGGEKAKVVIRPRLLLAGMPVSLSLLEDVRLVLTSRDLGGLPSTQEVSGFELFEDRESVHELQVPPRLESLNIALHARVEVISQGEHRDLSAQRTFTLNGGEATDRVEGLFLSATASGYVLDALGKNGEARAGRPIRLALKHEDFTEAVDLTLQTDERGRIELGALDDVESLRAQSPDDLQASWKLIADDYTYNGSKHARAGEIIEIPYMGSSAQPSRRELSLLEVRGSTFVADRFDALAVEDGFVKITGLPPGDYDLRLEEQGERVYLRVGAGEERAGYVLGRDRQLELRREAPLQIVRVETTQEELLVHLKHATPFTRVHVFADRLHPDYRPDTGLALGDVEPSLTRRTLPQATYLEGRQIGDEYRYIIDRKYAKKYPGNMLERPSLLLDPWPVRTTESGEQLARQGEGFGVGGGAGGRSGGRGRLYGGPGDSLPPDPSIGLDFLADPAAVLLNLRPGQDGIVRIPRGDLGSHQDVHVVAVEPLGTAYRRVTLPESPLETRELRLADALDAGQHLAQQKKISVLREQEQFVLGDIATSQLESYDTLADVYGYYVGLTNNPDLTTFAFVLGWPSLSEEEKRAAYSKHACHELSFFLFQKDPELFEAVIRPYLENKKDKTFLDDWLIGADLSGYVRPWPYGQLNVFERILLSQRLTERKEATAREISDRTDLLPTNLEAQNRLFRAALQSRTLDTADDLGLEAAQAEAANEARRQLKEEAEEPGDEKAKRPAPAESPAAKRQEADLEEGVVTGDKGYHLGRGADARARQRQLYRPSELTREWAENNYYHLSLAEMGPELVKANAFWKDVARHDFSEPFFSTHFPVASSSFTEMMLALALLDLPFKAGEHESTFDQRSMTLTAATPLILFHEEIEPVEVPDEPAPILISQSFYRRGQRYRQVGNERVDNPVRDELLAGVVYGCEVVVTNPTSSARKLQLLVQVPLGAIPVLGGRYTKSVDVDLQPYRTETLEYSFYFPQPGRFEHYPVHASAEGRLLAAAEPFTFNVVSELQNVDRESWSWISQNGTPEELFDFLDRANLYRIDLSKIAFRMKDPDVFHRTLDLLTGRHVYDHTLWSYSVRHDSVPDIRQFLQHTDGFVAQCGVWLDSALLSIEPVARRAYQHLDYRPLINARAHRLGRRRQILNDRFHQQYHELLRILSCQASLTDPDRMAVVYYLLLQDRIEEALEHFARVDPDALQTRLQYDYFVAYLDFYTPDLSRARTLAARYGEYPVDRWRQAFAAIAAQLAEIDGDATLVTDPGDRVQTQTQLADSTPTFDFEVEAKTVSIDHRNLDRLDVAYYLMDIELLFSRNPFVQEFSGQFSYIRPNRSDRIELPEEEGHSDRTLPASLHNSNVLVEISGGGQTKSRAYYSNSITLELSEPYGQLRVLDGETGDALSTVYVKVYARLTSGQIKFYKDGYTDRRGRFDYASLSTGGPGGVERFAILILSETHGATVREAAPPAQ